MGTYPRVARQRSGPAVLSRLAAVLAVAVLALVCRLIVPGASWAQEDMEETMLLFVGEDIEVLSIASRRQESAWQAPAIANVMSRQILHERGVQTLSQALAMVPGFYMAQKEWGSQPYLRGIPDSVLFLYDTVPLGSDVTKSLHPLDHELSLAPVKRIEVIRGPGSVLWGPDAFAGIVNVVPLTGKDLDGGEAGLTFGGPGSPYGAWANAGHDAGGWDAFLSASARQGRQNDTACNVVGFWGDGNRTQPIPPDQRYGATTPGRADYLEASGNFNYQDWLTVSGMLSDYQRPYAMSDQDRQLTWRESRSAPFGFLKTEARQDVTHASAVRFTGYYSYLRPEYEIIDLELDQKERTLYGELIYDHSLFAGAGLATVGSSYRDRRVGNAPIWDSYLPDYLGPDNLYHLPLVSTQDYHTRLWSAFGQYTHKIGKFDLLAGVRFDDHSDYQDHFSYNLGAVWQPDAQWIFKALYGTAYRTPFASQFYLEEKADLENIETLNLQAIWKPTAGIDLSAGAFFSRIDNHLMEDPYAGLSEPNNQRIEGIEFESRWRPTAEVELEANLTLMQNHGPDESYWYLERIEPDPDGGWIYIYKKLVYPYDAGPDVLINAMATWRPVSGISLFSRLGYFASRQLIYPRNDSYTTSSGVWLADVNVSLNLTELFSWKLPGIDGIEIGASVTNLLDERYSTPGTYSLIDGDPLEIETVLRLRW